MTRADAEAGIRQVPAFEEHVFKPRTSKYAVFVFVINEGERLLNQLERMRDPCSGVDVVVADGGSTDGSTDPEGLEKRGVHALLVKTGAGRLGAQMRMAFSWALDRGYPGVVTIDGNGKDGVEGVARFVRRLDEGYDHIQGSRFIPGGRHANTPRLRLLAVKFFHAPLLRWSSGFPYTDTTNGFRAYSARFLADPRVAVFRDVFEGYELHYYLARRAARLGFRCVEVPVARIYPKTGKAPTKISPIRGNLKILMRLAAVCSGRYDPS
jgi:dolichol-phosphate mannosyltransferase